MKLSAKKSSFQSILLAVFIYVLLFVVFLFNIYATDDFLAQIDYGSVFGCMKISSHIGNGRFLGNFLLSLCAFKPIVRIIFKPFILTCAILLSEFIFNVKELQLKIIVSLLMIIPSSGFFANCYIQNPSFINYVVPLFGILLCIAFIKISHNKSKAIRIFLVAVTFVCAFCSQLYSENTSVIFLVLACSMLAYNILNKKECLMYWGMLIGATIGFAVMLIVPKIMSLDLSEYRGFILNFPFAVGVVAKFSDYFSTAALWIALFGALQLFFLKKEAQNSKLYGVHVIIAAVYPGLCLFYKFTRTPSDKTVSTITLLLAMMMIVFFLNAGIIFLKYIKEKETRYFSIVLILLMGMSVGMFMFININGYRVFYLTLFIFICLNLYFLNYLKKRYPKVKNLLQQNRIKNAVCTILACCFAIMLPLQIIQEYDVQVIRQEYVEEKLLTGEKEIYLPKIPNKAIVRDIYLDFYEDFIMSNYPDVTVHFVDMEDWELNDKYVALLNNPVASVTYAINRLDYGNKKIDRIQKNT